MRFPSWQRWLKQVFGSPSPTTRRNRLHKPTRPLRLEALEDRVAPATNITIVATGVGTLDQFLSPTNGTITTADDTGDPAATLSAAALEAVGAGVIISIAADN